jgi:signal transduction histidine kinase
MELEAPSGGASAFDPERETALEARVLSRVIAGVVHDFRTPLGTMLMKLQLLRDALAGAGTMPEAAAAHLRVLDAQIERMTEMVRKVASTIDPPSHLGWVDAGALLADVAGAFGYEAKVRAVDLVVEPRAGAVRTAADPGEVGRLVLCLVGRTVTAAAPGRLAARAVARGGAAVLELDWTPAEPGPGLGYDLDQLAAAAAALGGRLERTAAGPGPERLSLTMPGTERT